MYGLSSLVVGYDVDVGGIIVGSTASPQARRWATKHSARSVRLGSLCCEERGATVDWSLADTWHYLLWWPRA